MVLLMEADDMVCWGRGKEHWMDNCVCFLEGAVGVVLCR